MSSKVDKIQDMTLLQVMGPDAIDVFITFTWTEDEDKTKLVDITKKFKEYCNPKKNVTYERHAFNTRTQKENEPVTEIQQKANVCEFGELNDFLISDKKVCGIRSDSVCARQLRELELALQSAIDNCRAAEVSKTHLREMGDQKTYTR